MTFYQWDFSFLPEYKNLFITGIMYTCIFTVIPVILGFIIGIVVALLRCSSEVNFYVQFLIRSYVEIFRCTPVMVQLIWVYYAFPVLTGLQISAISAALFTLSLYGGAFYAEILRGGILSLGRGQSDAAKSLGMSSFQVICYVITPQVLKNSIPSLINQLILQLKNTSLLSVLALPDLLYQGQVIAHDTYRPLEAYSFIAAIYFIILFPFTIILQKYEIKNK